MKDIPCKEIHLYLFNPIHTNLAEAEGLYLGECTFFFGSMATSSNIQIFIFANRSYKISCNFSVN